MLINSDTYGKTPMKYLRAIEKVVFITSSIDDLPEENDQNGVEEKIDISMIEYVPLEESTFRSGSPPLNI